MEKEAEVEEERVGLVDWQRERDDENECGTVLSICRSNSGRDNPKNLVQCEGT